MESAKFFLTKIIPELIKISTKFDPDPCAIYVARLSVLKKFLLAYCKATGVASHKIFMVEVGKSDPFSLSAIQTTP